eukprot:5205541-Amphidinium_carterae.2
MSSQSIKPQRLKSFLKRPKGRHGRLLRRCAQGLRQCQEDRCHGKQYNFVHPYRPSNGLASVMGV